MRGQIPFKVQILKLTHTFKNVCTRKQSILAAVGCRNNAVQYYKILIK